MAKFKSLTGILSRVKENGHTLRLLFGVYYTKTKKPFTHDYIYRGEPFEVSMLRKLIPSVSGDTDYDYLSITEHIDLWAEKGKAPKIYIQESNTLEGRLFLKLFFGQELLYRKFKWREEMKSTDLIKKDLESIFSYLDLIRSEPVEGYVPVWDNVFETFGEDQHNIPKVGIIRIKKLQKYFDTKIEDLYIPDNYLETFLMELSNKVLAPYTVIKNDDFNEVRDDIDLNQIIRNV